MLIFSLGFSLHGGQCRRFVQEVFDGEKLDEEIELSPTFYLSRNLNVDNKKDCKNQRLFFTLSLSQGKKKTF